MGGLERRRARGRSQPPPPLHCRRSPMMRVFVSKPDRKLHECLHTGAMDEGHTGAHRTPDLTDGNDVTSGRACGRSRLPPPFYRWMSSIMYMIKPKTDR